MPREKVQAAPTARPKVPMRRGGADCFVVAMKRGNARGAKEAGHRRWIGSTDVGQPTAGGARYTTEGGSLRAVTRAGGIERFKSGSLRGSGPNPPALHRHRP